MQIASFEIHSQCQESPTFDTEFSFIVVELFGFEAVRIGVEVEKTTRQSAQQRHKMQERIAANAFLAIPLPWKQISIMVWCSGISVTEHVRPPSPQAQRPPKLLLFVDTLVSLLPSCYRAAARCGRPMLPNVAGLIHLGKHSLECSSHSSPGLMSVTLHSRCTKMYLSYLFVLLLFQFILPCDVVFCDRLR
jgi:hypothetical protein